MKYALAVSSLVLSLSLHASNAFSVGPRSLSRYQHSSKGSSGTVLRSLATPPTNAASSSSSPGRSSEEIQSELSSGKLMEGGKVIDFSSVKASSRAEEAMAQARHDIVAQDVNGNGGLTGSASSTAILGINQDVIDLVGHELATFATQTEIQDCAVYLRSQASTGLFTAPSDGTVVDTKSKESYSAEQIERYETLLKKSYDESGEVTSAYAKTFYMGTMLMSPKAQKAIWAIYVWCRRTDEIVDAPRENDDDMLTDLSSWEMRLENLWNHGLVYDVYDLCLLDCRVSYPTLDITPFMDMIRGMLMDVPNLGQDRYELFDELHLYCYRVAGTVGLMSLPVFGCAEGYTDEIAREPALSLGVAFQLTNILRDVGEDAVDRGRVYLPQEDLKRFGVTEQQVFDKKVDENYQKLMKFEIDRARMYYERARRGVFMLAPDSRLPVQSSLDAYGRILDKIEANGYDNLTKRAYVDKWEKLSIIPFSWYRTLDISRTFPLPGDKQVVDLDV